MRGREREVLRELLKDGRATDQEIARRLETSRPSIARIRKRLESRGVILGYAPIVSFEAVDLHVNALTLYRWADYSKREELNRSIEHIKGLPEVIMFIRGEGIGSKTKMILSVHRNLREYETFIRSLQEHWGPNVMEVESFLSSLDTIHKRYDLAGPIRNALQ